MRTLLLALLAHGAAYLAAGAAEAGHEFPFYPSFYPQEITLKVLDQAAARAQLAKSLHAYLGTDPFVKTAKPAGVSFVESLGSYVVVTFNPASRVVADAAGRCAAASSVGKALAGKTAWVIHPYPITPYHADYLYHFDRAEAATHRLGATGMETAAALKLRARGRVAQELAAAGWRVVETEWDAVVEEIDVDDLVARDRGLVNGQPGPAWMKDGWFHAYRLHAGSLADGTARRAAEELLQRRLTGGFTNAVERLNLERDLVRRVTLTCERTVLGYGVRRQGYNVEYSEGIENVAHDAHGGLGSAIFVRTAKLKDFPWNGWMRLAVATKPGAAWNPVAGFTDPAGRVLWSALGDPALLPSPYGTGWIANRVTPTGTASVPIPSDALVPDAAGGALEPAASGQALRVGYKVLLSAFHDGTRMGVADVLYPYVFAARWSAPARRTAGGYDPVVDRASAVSRDWLAGVKVVKVEKDLKDFGEVKLFWDSAHVDVYLRHPADELHAVAIAPPWSTVPWHLLVLMEEAVTRGVAAFSEREARRRGTPWLDLARDPKVAGSLAALVNRFERHAYVPEPLRKLVTADEARGRWSALRRFYRERRHLLVTNGPYRLDRWSADGVVLQVFRDLTYPLTVGTFDRFALPLRAHASAIERDGDRLLITAEVERVSRSQREYAVARTPLGHPDTGAQPADVPVCHWIVLGADGEIVATGSSQRLAGTAQRPEADRLVVDLTHRLPAGAYRVLVALVLNENFVGAEVTAASYVVAAR